MFSYSFFPPADAIAVVKKVRDGFVGDVFPDPAFAHIADEICGEIIASLKKLSAPSGSRDVFGEYDRFEEVVP